MGVLLRRTEELHGRLAAVIQAKVLLGGPGRKDECRRSGNLGGTRQWAGSTFGTLKDQPGWNGTAAAPGPGPRAHRPAAAGPGRPHLAQPGHRPARNTVADRL
ncbi:MAG TPA: hypothetical protein VKV80_19545 [Streptosporangiaceae bacterium]|nr:hypothetical protein [Streptosporangiaceae bacterium]